VDRNMPHEHMALEDKVRNRTPVHYRGFYLISFVSNKKKATYCLKENITQLDDMRSRAKQLRKKKMKTVT
jgi:hypothetical protein